MTTHYVNPDQQRMNELAEALPDIVSRHGTEHPAVAKVGETIVPHAVGYPPTLNQLRQQRISAKAALVEGHAKVDALLERVRVWRATVARDVAGCQGERFAKVADKPTRVIAYGTYLIELAREHGGDLPYADVMIAELEPVLAEARTAWQAAHLERVALTRLQREVRSRGKAFSAELVKLRRVMQSVLGAEHPDVRMLRVTRMRASADDDDVAADATPSLSTSNGVSASAPTTTTKA